MPRRGVSLTRGSNFGKSRRIKSVATSLNTRLRGKEQPGGGIDIGVRVRGKTRSTIRGKKGGR